MSHVTHIEVCNTNVTHLEVCDKDVIHLEVHESRHVTHIEVYNISKCVTVLQMIMLSPQCNCDEH